jgi:hypothetical protein
LSEITAPPCNWKPDIRILQAALRKYAKDGNLRILAIRRVQKSQTYVTQLAKVSDLRIAIQLKLRLVLTGMYVRGCMIHEMKQPLWQFAHESLRLCADFATCSIYRHKVDAKRLAS